MSDPSFIVFEGIDGAGKSTLSRAWSAHLTEQGIDHLLIAEPTPGPHGRALREMWAQGRTDLAQERRLFILDRRWDLEERIDPTLGAGRWVLLDRYFMSTVAYQGSRDGSGAAILAENLAFARTPDLTLLVDLDAGLALDRLDLRGDKQRDPHERLDRLIQVRQEYLERIGAIPHVILDGTLGREALFSVSLKIARDHGIRVP